MPASLVADSVKYICDTLGLPEDGRIVANVHMLWVNAVGNDPALWQQLLDHLCWPEETPFPDGLFLTDNPSGYSRIMSALEELYDE
jgi:hypothetical protein